MVPPIEAQGQSFHLQYADEPIPLEKLGRDNPILHYGEVPFFEDEFGDKGYCRANVRYRVMQDCFFVLQRVYVRVDQVCARILDTRIYHEFGTQKIYRDFALLESTYEELDSKGYHFPSFGAPVEA